MKTSENGLTYFEIGETFTVKRGKGEVKLMCVEREPQKWCVGCAFERRKLSACLPYYCSDSVRPDGKNVKFVRV